MIDNLECLSDVQVAEKKLFLIQGDKPQLMNWEKYGLRIRVQEGTLSSSETVEAAVVALVGGQFQFPPNTVLVSAVYAVSLSKPLLKRFKLEIQHCVDLTGQPDLARYLKFAIAPVSTPSLPYQFSIVEGGEFSYNSGYGFIERKDFCLVCILGLIIVSMTGGGGGGGQQQQGQGAGVVPAQQQQRGNTLTVLTQQQQPGVNQQTNGQQGGDTLTVLTQQQQPGVNQQTNGQPGGDTLTVLAQQQQPRVNQQTNGQPGEQAQEGEQLQSQDGQQEEGERESQEQPEALELQQQGGQEEDPVHVETAKGKEDKEHFDENNVPGGTPPVACKSESEVVNKPTTESKDGKYIHSIDTVCIVYILLEVHSTGVKEATKYAGLVYYEEKGVEDLITFTAAKKLDALLEVIHMYM